jgi:apolipoprotein N-acyltransferase
MMAKVLRVSWPLVLAASGSALLSMLSFPPFDLWPLALVAWLPLLRWLDREAPSPKRALQAGWLAGTLLHLVFYWWLVHTMQAMSGFPFLLALLLHVIYAAVMGLHQGVALGLVRLLVPTRPTTVLRSVGRALAVGVIWASVEFAVPYLFPWYQGNAFFRTPILAQAADIIGIPGVSILCLTAASLLAQALVAKPFRWQLLVPLAAMIAAWLGYGQWRIGQVDAAPEIKTLHALVVQGNATLKEKLSEGQARIPMVARPEKLTRAEDLSQIDVVIWPEGTLPFFWIEDPIGDKEPGKPKERTRSPQILRDVKWRVVQLEKAIQKPLLTGTLRRPDMLWKEEARNSAILLRPDGSMQYYDKKILLPFGEYLPGSSLIPALKESIPGVSHMDPGVLPGRMDVAGVKLLVNICYEALYPAFLRAEGEDAEVLVNLTNDIWFGPDPAPTDHLMVQTARPVELRRPLVRSTATGITVYVDAAGRMHEPTELNVEAVRRWNVPVKDLQSPYRFWGDAPMWLLTSAVVLLALWRRKFLTSGAT